jgi:iron(II)-dependent oxidoreductase
MHDPLADWVRDARRRTLDLVADLDDDQLMGPRLSIVNPLLWEIGHVAWFQENWVLRHALGERPMRQDGDALWDSGAIPHDTRWDLPLPPREETLSYMQRVHDRVLELLEAGESDPRFLYFVRYTIFHEDMHDEAFTYTRQTLSYPPPLLSSRPELLRPPRQGDGASGDVRVDGGVLRLGAEPDGGFAFDNEKWAHPVEIEPFLIARTAVSQRQYADFVEDGGYRRRELWSEEGWLWRVAAGAEHPVYWRRTEGGWQRRDFDRWLALEPNRPVIHVSWFEAQAYCRWAGRRLPTEAEWEAAASTALGGDGRRRFPWGDASPGPEKANLDGWSLGCVDADALPAGDSAFGCRQMLGNVWEWTDTTFLPYPGFVADAYRDYSEPWFGTHKVLRGGCWVTRGRLLRNTWRNYYTPDRRDVWAGFRTCRARE